MHINTHLKPESEGKTGLGVYPDGMVEHDGHVGQILDKLKELGLDDNTIVMYSTDNGAECFTWPDGGTTPFRGEKNENWEGGYRVPCAIRWPGVIKPGTVNNDLFSHEDMLPTLLAAAGVPDVKEQLLQGHEGRQEDLQGPSRRLQHHRSARRQGRESAQGVLLLERRRLAGGAALQTTGRSSSRSSAAKASTSGRTRSRRCASRRSSTCVPIRSSGPSRSASATASGRIDRTFLLVPAQEYVAQYIGTFKEFPPSQKVGSFSLDQVLDRLTAASTSGK